MSLFNALYTMGSCRMEQPIYDNSTITIELANRGNCPRVIAWAKWIVTFPLRAVHGIYNTLLIAVAKDINAVAARQIYSGNAINYMPFSMGKSGHIITSERVISAIGRHFRHDPEGPFERDSDDTIVPILIDLFPEDQVDEEDFLFTCSQRNVSTYRKPLLDYIGPKALPRLRPQITAIAVEVIDSIKESGVISARCFAETYTVAILARLFLNHPGTLEELQNIGRAASSAFEYQITKKWGELSPNQIKQYGADLDILRKAIGLSKGEFREVLQASGFSEIRLNGELFILYGAGSETTSSSLQYILWRLGQDSALQDKLRDGSEDDIKSFISDCFQKYTPVSLFSRFARQDLLVNVQNPDGSIWEYPIAKEEALIMAPYLARRMFFGAGQHACPGQWLARQEMISLIVELLKRYEIVSFPKKRELSTVPGNGFLKVEPVELSLHKRI